MHSKQRRRSGKSRGDFDKFENKVSHDLFVANSFGRLILGVLICERESAILFYVRSWIDGNYLGGVSLFMI